MTEDEKTEPTEETARDRKAADSTAQAQTGAKADDEVLETEAPVTEMATERKGEREAEASPSVEDRLAETMTNYCGHSPNRKHAAARRSRPGRSPQIRGRELCPRHAGSCR